MRLARAIPVRPKPRSIFPAGPFVGMRDSLDPTSSRPDLARLLENCYPQDPQFGGAVVGRPGLTLTTGQGGSAGARTGQLAYQFTKKDGTEYTVRIIGGKFETYNWSTDTWSNVVTAANFTTAGITLSATARCYAVTFADVMIVSDGVNTPWSWDGASGAGGLTLLSNSFAMYGQPFVYYAKWGGIKASDRSEFGWSEENQPNVGFEAGGFNNVWQLGQTDQNALTAMIGTNEALYAFRGRSITAIGGAVTPDFSTSGTREGVSETEGTTSPASVFRFGRKIFFANAEGRPHVISPGAGVDPVWGDYRETIGGLDPAQLDDIEGFYDPSLQLAMFGVAETGADRRNAQLAYHMRGAMPQACGIFRGYDFDRVGVVKNGSGEPTVMHLDSSGYAYYHGSPVSGPWNDELQAGTELITHVVETPYLGADTFIEKNWDRIDFTFRLATDLTNLSLQHYTPRGLSTAQTATLEGNFARWDVAEWDVDSWSSESLEKHKAFGLLGNGRWLVARLLHEGDAEQFGLLRADAWASLVGPFPGTP